MTKELKLIIYKPRWIKHSNGRFEFRPKNNNDVWWDDLEELKNHWCGYELLAVWDQANPQYIIIENGSKTL